MRAIWKRELQSYFHTPLGYLYVGIFLLTGSFVFYTGNLYPRSSDMSGFFAMMSYVWMLLSPILVMRQIAGERRQMTDQLLMTSPVSIPRIVLGKFSAAVSVLMISALLSLPLAAITAIWGRLFPAEFITMFLGFVLQGIALTALDFFVTSLLKNAATAFLAAFAVNLFTWLADLVMRAAQNPLLAAIARFFSLYDRFVPFLSGQLSFANIAFYVLFSALMVFLTIRALDARRWSELS
ncbi:MAG: hypothetical protein GX916_06105 [Clostridiales bacterium]|nr:hypothetical protein [Clostridiales bacterium]